MLFLNSLAISSVAQTVENDSLLPILDSADIVTVAEEMLFPREPQSVDSLIVVDSLLQSVDSLVIVDSLPQPVDTIWMRYPHPLCMPLMYVPEVFPPLNDTTHTPDYTIESIRKNARRYLLTNHADLYVSISDPDRLKAVEIGHTKVHRAIIRNSEKDKVNAKRALRELHSPWQKWANLSLQLTQNYATKNWHQGAVNAFSMLWSAKAFANYKKDNLSWENNAVWRVGVSTISGDTLHKMNTTDDIFQIYSKFGYQVHKKWYITLFADFQTNLFPNFQQNTNKLNTTIFTPIRYTMGVGVDYKPIKGLSINFSPATYKLIYAFKTDPERVDVTVYGVATGNNMLNEVGSSLRVQWHWKPLREIKLDAKFYFFTNYKQVETELEIDIDFYINKYMSAKLLLHPRYDGTVESATDYKSKIQFKELISVGFAHTFR